ncbi:MAG: hypothetical protein IIA05_01605 [Proteobacteria bacterium]|nr:hypothetical protein [Pseudomonadota bacterium]
MTKKRDPEVRKKFLAKQDRQRAPAGYEVDHIKPLRNWMKAWVILTVVWFVLQSAHQLSQVRYIYESWTFWVAYFVGSMLLSAAVIGSLFILQWVVRAIWRWASGK